MMRSGLALRRAPGRRVRAPRRRTALRSRRDFSGEESLETAAASAKGKAVRLEISNAAGKRLARAEAPSPGRHPQIVLRAGSIGSAGALLEVAASEGGTVCRSVWRFHDGALARLPVRQAGTPLPDCEPEGQWLTRWEEAKDAPALYVRERTREVPPGILHETQAFAFAGFELASDAKKSGAEINGVAIPEWYDAALYFKAELDVLFQRFGFSSLRKAPRLRFETARAEGTFAVVLEDREGRLRLPVTASKPLEGADPGVELAAGDPPARILGHARARNDPAGRRGPRRGRAVRRGLRAGDPLDAEGNPGLPDRRAGAGRGGASRRLVERPERADHDHGDPRAAARSSSAAPRWTSTSRGPPKGPTCSWSPATEPRRPSPSRCGAPTRSSASPSGARRAPRQRLPSAGSRETA